LDHEGYNPVTVARARDFFDRALAADPENVDALLQSAHADAAAALLFAAAEPMALLSTAEAKTVEVLSFAPNHAVGHLILGIVYIHTKRAAEGISECEHALSLDWNLANGHYAFGIGKLFYGPR
jgi:tetratricopeptide (TPR) repeat protein